MRRAKPGTSGCWISRMRHCLTTRRVLVRGDGSTAHEGIFDRETGEFLRQSTHQGWRGDSCWSRGLAWALYGFGTCYEYSRDPHFCETAEALRRFLHYPHARTTECRRGTSTRPPRAASRWILPRRRSPRRDCCGCARLVADPVKGHLYWTTRHPHPAHSVRRYLAQRLQGLGRRAERRRLPHSQESGRE